MEVIVMIYLAVLSLEDICRKELPVWQIVLGLLAAVALTAVQWKGSFQEIWIMLLGLLPALVFLAAAGISKEQIGYGDGLLLLPLGMVLGFERTAWMVLWALSLAAVCALALFVLYRRKKGLTIPFVPFLFAGYVLTGGMI